MVEKKRYKYCTKKSGRAATEGLVSVAINETSGVIVEINSETDFVAKNENFQKFCMEITNLCLSKKLNNKESLLKQIFKFRKFS